MRAPTKLSIYGGVLAVVFAAAGFTANAVAPEETVQSWVEDTEESDHADGHGIIEASPLGLSLAQDGYQITEVLAPNETGAQDDLSLDVTGPDGQPVTDFEVNHAQEMHLIAVRADGQHFRHVHPERDETGTWSIPWNWEAAGTYRVFADFVPADTGEGITLSTTVQVAGNYGPAPANDVVTETTVDDFDVAVEGDLIAGEASELTIGVTREGEPITALEPYLGAFGHLVALRDGDLAYLHVHPHGDSPEAGETSGPQIVFETTAPTEGRYLLFLDFQVDGEVYTAPLVLDTITGGTDTNATSEDDSDSGDSHDEQGEDHDH